MRYVRGRRLSKAARRLAAARRTSSAVAIDAGYGSHEAFTRAFREQFGLTPEALRARGHLDNLVIVEPIKMDETLLTHLEPPRFEDGKAFLVAGLERRYTQREPAPAIPSQWQRFNDYFGKVPGQVGNVAYGVCYNADDAGNIDYLCGVEVSDFSALPAELSRLRISAAALCGVQPPRASVDDAAHLEHDLESVAAGIGTYSRRCAQLRAL